MKVTLAGWGCGNDTWTREAEDAVKNADLVIGSARLLALLPEISGKKREEVRAESILSVLEEENPDRAGVLLSGDSGFYSGAAKLASLLEEKEISYEILPGISSLQAFSARIKRPWQEWRLCSEHGAFCDPVHEVMQEKPVFFLTSGENGPASLCRALTDAGLSDLAVTVGENLGLTSEKIERGTAGDFADRRFEKMNVMLAEAAPVYKRRTPGIPDEEFIRRIVPVNKQESGGDIEGEEQKSCRQVPMTKQMVRAAMLSCLGVSPDDVCWDIGTGTGSTAVELSLCSREVWSVERDEEALAAARKNREKFCAWNLHLISGEAPDVLQSLPAPDAVFVGGSGGKLGEIFDEIFRANPHARICVSAIALETLEKAVSCFKKYSCVPEITQISVSRARQTGGLSLMTAQNPVFLITGRLS